MSSDNDFMKKRRIFAVISACLAAAAIGVLFWPRERVPDPQYNGIPLSTWLLQPGGGVYDVGFTKAINGLGTNALPLLIRSVDYEVPKWRICLYWKIVPKMPLVVLNSRPMLWLLDDKSARRAHAATDAFGQLGCRAAPALNDLRRISNKHPMGYACKAISNIMSSIPGDFNETSANLN
jgi:hypothetical protein